jgi:hypothetical protein
MRGAAVAALALILVACGKDSNGPALPAGFECLGKPLPTTAPSTIHITGQLKANALSPTALPSARIEAFKTGSATALDTTTSDGAGMYTLNVSTGGAPVDGFVRVSKSGYDTTYGYPPVPLSADATENIVVLTSSEVSFLANAVGVTPTAGDGLIIVIVTDCAGTTLTGATVAANPAGTVKYNAGGAPSSSATSTASDGIAYLFNVAPGNVTITATGSGHVLRQHVVTAHADAVTLTQIQP